MRGNTVKAFITAVACLLIMIPVASAQQMSLEYVVILPVAADDTDRALADELFSGLLASIHVPLGKSLIDQATVEDLMSNRTPSDILKNEAEMESFASLAGASFLLGVVLKRLDGGRFEVHSISYGREDRDILNYQAYVFENEAALRTGAAIIGEGLSKARNYSSADSALFMALVIPGLGQLQKQEPIHALLSATLVAGAIVYGATTPSADPYEFDRDKFTHNTDFATGEITYFVHGIEVDVAEFVHELDADWEHHLNAAAERRAVDIRRRRATGLVVLAYLANVADALILTREKVDTSPFFMSLDVTPASGSLSRPGSFRLQLGIRFR